MCKQKITERCVNISKIKNNYLLPTTSLPYEGATIIPSCRVGVQIVVKEGYCGFLIPIFFVSLPIIYAF